MPPSVVGVVGVEGVGLESGVEDPPPPQAVRVLMAAAATATAPAVLRKLRRDNF